MTKPQPSPVQWTRGDQPTITFEPFPPVRGRKRVLIDGVPWAIAVMDSHGSRGVSYWFQQIGGDVGPIQVPSYTKQRTCEVVTKDFKVFGDNQRHGRIEAIGTDKKTTAQPIEAKLIAGVRELIAGGYLIDPKQAAINANHEHAEFLARIDAANRAAEAELIERANEVVRMFADQLGTMNSANLLSAIVEAMKWAQSK